MNHKHWVKFQCLNLFAKKCWCPRPTRERIQQIEHHTKNVRCGDASEFYSTKFRGKKWKDPWVQKQIVEAWLTFDILSHRILKLCLSLLNRNLICKYLPKTQLMKFFLAVKCQDLPRCIRLHTQWRYPLKVKKGSLSIFLFFSFSFVLLSSLAWMVSHIYKWHGPNGRSAFRQAMSNSREKVGHTTIDLGVAPEKVEHFENGEVILVDPTRKLGSVRGFLVSFPLEFMCQEKDLRPMFIESEFYTSPQVFYWDSIIKEEKRTVQEVYIMQKWG